MNYGSLFLSPHTPLVTSVLHSVCVCVRACVCTCAQARVYVRVCSAAASASACNNYCAPCRREFDADNHWIYIWNMFADFTKYMYRTSSRILNIQFINATSAKIILICAK